jgi:energy-coupling factor transport system permease protein
MTFWSRLDPRSKVLVLFAGSAALAAAPVSRVWLALPFTAALLLSAGLSRARLGAALRGVAVLWLLSLLVNGFLVAGERLGPQALGWLRPTREGLSAGLAQGGRLAALTALMGWGMATLGALELAGSVEWTVRRVPALRRRAHRALLPVVLALRMIPLLLDEAERLLQVEALRGGPWRGRGRLRRAARLAPLWVFSVIERAEALALALTLRGYRPERSRGFARTYRWGGGDWLLVGAGALGVFALWAR